MRNKAPFVRRAVSMTPLIDVVFLLLLFFMLTSTFLTFGEIELAPATPGGEASGTPELRSFVQLGATRLVLNGVPLALDALNDALQPGQVLVSLDDDTTAQRLVDLLAEMRGRPDLNVVVLE